MLTTDAFPILEKLSLSHTPIGSSNLALLLQALEQSACVHTLRELNLSRCGICAEGAKVLGSTIERNSLPSLQKLDISSNKLGNDGVTYLTQGLQASPLTKLKDLELKYVEMDNAGRESLADLIGSGAFKQTRILLK